MHVHITDQSGAEVSGQPAAGLKGGLQQDREGHFRVAILLVGLNTKVLRAESISLNQAAGDELPRLAAARVRSCSSSG